MLSTLGFTSVAFTTAGDAADGLIFGWEIATVQKWALIYLLSLIHISEPTRPS